MDPAKPAPRPRSRRRWIGPLIRVPLLVYAGIIAFFFFTQTRLIFPGSQTQGRPEALVRRLPGAEVLTLVTKGGDRVAALFGKALGPDGRPLPDASTRPTLLYFYGNAMSLRDATDQFQQFRRLGANVMIPEYAGYGMSEGRPGEAGCRETGEAALEYLEASPDVDRSRVVVGGWSLGGAVALDLASRHRFAGVATFCTFTRMADLARRMLPFLPASLLLRHRFENLSKIGRIGCPMLIGHGRVDQVIPFAMADRLAGAARTPVTRLTIEGADHNDFFDVGGSKVLASLGRFLDGLPPAR